MFTKLKNVVRQQINQGVQPRELALTFALAFVLAVFPLIGFTTLLCFLAATAFRLNQPLIQILNYAFAAFQLLLIPVFLKTGEWIVGAPHLSINPLEIVEQFSQDWRVFLARYGMAGLHAILAWAVLSPFFGGAIYVVSLRLLEKFKRKTV